MMDGDGDVDGAESLPFPSDCFYLSISMGQPARLAKTKRLAIQSIYYIRWLRCAECAHFFFAWFTIIVAGVKCDSSHYYDMEIISSRSAISLYTCNRELHSLMQGYGYGLASEPGIVFVCVL
jgi:hypothetical protein